MNQVLLCCVFCVLRRLQYARDMVGVAASFVLDRQGIQSPPPFFHERTELVIVNESVVAAIQVLEALQRIFVRHFYPELIQRREELYEVNLFGVVNVKEAESVRKLLETLVYHVPNNLQVVGKMWVTY